jgi:Dullard-like phosphatase family protein
MKPNDIILRRHSLNKITQKLKIAIEEPSKHRNSPYSTKNLRDKTPSKIPPLSKTISKTPAIFNSSFSPSISHPLLPRKCSYSRAVLSVPGFNLTPTAPKKFKVLKKKLDSLKCIVAQHDEKNKEIPYEDYLNQALTSLTFIKTFPPVDLKQVKERRVMIPRKPGYELRKTLIFDLDETLVHCCLAEEPADVTMKITLPNGIVCDAGINIRPFAIDCLKTLSKTFEIFVFTASHSCYADKVCDYLDPMNQYIHQRFYRQHCITVNGVFIKDLRIFKNRRLKDIVIVENTLHCVAYQLDNCIPIVSWFSNKQDQELQKLMIYLKKIEEAQDVRVINLEHFNLSSY